MKNLLILLSALFFYFSGRSQCTTLSNNYTIAGGTTALICSGGTYSGVTINGTIRVINGVTLTLTNPTFGVSGSFSIENGSTVNITKTASTVTGTITVIDGATLNWSGSLTTPSGGYVLLDNTGTMKVTGAFTSGCVVEADFNTTLNCLSSVTFNTDAYIGGLSFNAASLTINGLINLDCKTTVSGTTTVNAAYCEIGSCKFTTANFVYAAPANSISGSGYMIITGTLTSNANSWTLDNTFKGYRTAGWGTANTGSMQQLGALISPSPC